MFSLKQLLNEVKRLGCPDPIAHVRWLRSYARRNGGMTWIQSLYSCSQRMYYKGYCPVPDRIVQEMARELGLTTK